MRPLLWTVGCLAIGFAGVVSAGESNDVDPFWVLLHEPAVIEDLDLTADQNQRYQDLMDELDLRFFPLRNKPPQDGQDGLQKLIAEARTKLKDVLTSDQFQRLGQIHLWRLGTASLLHDDVAGRMRYADEQRKKMQAILTETQTALAAIEKQVQDGQPRAPLEKKYGELKTSEQKKLLKLMKPEQQTAWKEALGPQFDTTKLGKARYKAPEIVPGKSWLNSRPLTLADQRGKVVVLNFYAAGCINCIHNFPHYRDWAERFRGKDVVQIGIQTPETSAERDLDHVRQKATEEKLTFPILFDEESANWNAWGNAMWPCVYLIDKRGYLRHFWAGELNWQGNNGEKWMRERIETLLAEP